MLLQRVLLFGIILWLFAAGQAQARINVVTSIEDLADIARTIGDDRVEVTSITKGTQNPHFIETKPSFIMKFNRADLLAYVGLELEIGWLPLLRDSARNPRILPGARGDLDMSVGIPVIELPTGKVDRSLGDIHPLGNPHYWLNPEYGLRMARRLEERLAELDPSGAATYRHNRESFDKQLTEHMANWQKRLAPLRGQPLVAYHKSFNYFAQWAGLNVLGFVEPKPGVPPSPQHTAELIQLIKDKRIKAIMVEPFYSPSVPRFIAQKTGAKALILPSSVRGVPGADSYFDVFERLVTDLEKALKG